VKAEHLKLSKVKKTELFNFMKETRNKEEYRRASAIKQKLEGLSYRTIARNLDVNYRNVYNWIKEYKEYGLDGIRSKRDNAGRIPKISSDKNKERIKEIITKSPRTFGYLKIGPSCHWHMILISSLVDNPIRMQTLHLLIVL
jgi:transposase